jgi:hypothetical protein
VVLTLVAVLFIHLIFTAQYHWPLAPVNYVLQISGVSTLLISLVATLHVVLSATQRESAKWPYMLSYIAVNVPPLEDAIPPDNVHDRWSVAEKATWLVMNASTSGLIQVGWLVGYRSRLIMDVDHTYPVPHSVVSFSSGGPAHIRTPGYAVLLRYFSLAQCFAQAP